MPRLNTIRSPRSIAFIVKGLCDYNLKYPSTKISTLIKILADRLIEYYKQHTSPQWHRFEASLTYDNSVLPESLLYAYHTTGDTKYKEIAKESFDFLLNLIFTKNGIRVIPNDGWLRKGEERKGYGDQPIDVASTVMVLTPFYSEFNTPLISRCVPLLLIGSWVATIYIKLCIILPREAVMTDWKNIM